MTDPDSNDLDLLKQGDRRNVTVLFTDMEGFTPLAHRMDPEEIDTLMGTVFSEFENIIHRHDGTVEKYIGDALVAVFGIPRIHEDDPARAIHAALDFYRLVEELNRKLSFGNLRFRTGIHTGLITTGKRGDHSVVTGHTMNLAARLQGAAEPGTILVSNVTLEECNGEFSTGNELEIQAKGLVDSIHARQILGKSPHSLKEERDFTGHEDLLQTLLTSYLRFDGTSPNGIILTGVAGIGKTAIAKQLIQKIRQYPAFSAPILHVRARKFQNRPFAAMTDIFLNYIHLPQDVSPEMICCQLEEVLEIPDTDARLFPSVIDNLAIQKAPGQYLAMFTRLMDSAIKNKSQGPYQPVLFIDNVSFIDTQSQDFLKFYFQKAEKFPYVILTDREPREELLSMVPGVPSVEIQPLDTPGATDLLSNLLKHFDTKISPDIFKQVLQTTQGIPLFIHSYARYLSQISKSDPQSQNKETTLDIPANIQNVYLAELTTYNEDLRDLLKKLSVFQHSFSMEDALWIQEYTDGDPLLVRRAFDFFLQQEILSLDQDSYFFRHDVHKKALYTSLLNHNKKILHRLVAQRMREQNSPHPIRLIHHLTRSDAFEDGFEVFKNSPDRYINMDFLPYLEIISGKIGKQDLDTRLTILFSRCTILFNNGLVNEADVIVQEMLSWGITHNHPEFAARAYHILTGYNTKSFRFQKAYYCGIKSLDFYQRSANPVKPINNLIQIIIHGLLMQNHQDRAAEILERLKLWGANQSIKQDREIRFAEVEFWFFQRKFSQAWNLLNTLRFDEDGKEKKLDFIETRFAFDIAWGRFDLPAAREFGLQLLNHPHLEPATRSRVCSRMAVIESILSSENPDSYMNQASFYVLRCQNDFDQLLAQSTRITCMLSLNQFEQGREASRNFLPLALRHSAFIPTFSVLIALAECAARENNSDEVAHCLIEAGHIYRMGMSLDSQDLLLYFYFLQKFHHLLDPKASEGLNLEGLTTSFFTSGDTRVTKLPASLEEVYTLLKEEIPDPQARENLFQTRCFPAIMEHLVSNHKV